MYNVTMSDIKVYLIMGAAAVLIIVLLSLFLKYKKTIEEDRQKALAKKQALEAKKKGLLVTCPLCGCDLMPGEDLFSRVYRPMNVPDQLCTINGCPHCFPKPEPGLKRECPVCHKEVPLKDGHLIARLFNKSDGKKHVIVTGCTQCSRGVK